MPWGRYRHRGNWNNGSRARASCSSSRPGRAGQDTGAGSNSGHVRSSSRPGRAGQDLGHGRSNIAPGPGSRRPGPTSGSIGRPTSGSTGRSTGSRWLRSEPIIEVITLSSSESEGEDLEILAANLRRMSSRKTGRKYVETNREHVHSNRYRPQ